jgi:hypothetical protein
MSTTMNADETTAVLKIRRDLTGETFNDGTIGAWTLALGSWPLVQVRTALIAAAREANRVNVAHVVDRLPQRSRLTAPPTSCELCDGTGWVESPPERAHRPSVCTPRPAVVCTCEPTEERPCTCKLAPAVECHCHAVEPCRCSTGKRAVDVHRSIVEHNDRTRRTDLLEGDPPPDTLRHWSEREPDPELF